MSKTVAAVFKSGNSQAVRIPVSHRLDTDKVEIERVPEGILLRPIEATIGDAVARLREYQLAEGIGGGLIEELEELPTESLPSFDEN
ncbi:AbrB/MazE/SpoVT family DNA-binding domain-containing protein [Corynebacterium aquatimens]|uniref:antitoxin n=1 Tax=Corynebacterium TaxID=1716 RepID=UPI001F448DB9|nr:MULTISPECIES: AbrB/MazE/SpoVT family DNA-binding domain-containing protein [Corynebacterium]QYH20077.1 AbrB/MazE/SpoVT family DNA-binding domain-containing protein [Corynebacterium aquatimens]UIZ92711.1 AbrB/MazE/SpoVT family DNA-binding domain-containing protein [Corynebacterium sp. CNCTC7651]